MVDYFNDFWLGAITAEVINLTIHHSKVTCSGCRDQKFSPLLHLCQQQGLEAKLMSHMEAVRGLLIPRIPELFERFQRSIENTTSDRDVYVTNARFFLVQATPQSIYFGTFLNESNDAFIKKQMQQEIPQPVQILSRDAAIKKTRGKRPISQKLASIPE